MQVSAALSLAIVRAPTDLWATTAPFLALLTLCIRCRVQVMGPAATAAATGQCAAVGRGIMAARVSTCVQEALIMSATAWVSVIPRGTVTAGTATGTCASFPAPEDLETHAAGTENVLAMGPASALLTVTMGTGKVATAAPAPHRTAE